MAAVQLGSTLIITFDHPLIGTHYGMSVAGCLCVCARRLAVPYPILRKCASQCHLSISMDLIIIWHKVYHIFLYLLHQKCNMVAPSSLVSYSGTDSTST